MESKWFTKRSIFCDICNWRFTTVKLLLEHFEDAEHKELLLRYPENGVKLKGLEPGYDAASLIALMNCYGTTVYTSCPPRRRYATFVFQDAHSAKALLAARKVDFFEHSLKVMPLLIPRAPQPTDSGQTSQQSGNLETLPLQTQALLPVGSQATLPTPTQLRRSRRDRKQKRSHDEQLRQPNIEQVTTNKKKPVRQLESLTEVSKKRSTQQATDAGKCVLIKGFGSRKDLDGLKDMMGTFGKIVDSRCSAHGLTATFQFEDSCSAAAVLNFGRLEFGGRKLVVRSVKNPPRPFAENSFQRTASMAVNLIETSRPTDEQLTELEQSVTDCVKIRESRIAAMLSDISNAIGELYPGMVLHPFGSSATGLAFFDSDLDLFIELPVPDKNCVIRVTKQLRRVGHPFCEVVPVLGAKTPLVKFQHAFTGLSCDISFKNCLGVRNSRLLRHYMNLNIRVRQLMLAVKLWARIQGVASGRGGATSYALGLMVIFFLQKLGLVPPVADLLQSEDHAETVDGWACGFRPRHDKISIEESLANLLRSFFHFYRQFEWERFVVCPLLGKEIDREDLLDADKLPSEMGSLKAKLAGNESMGFQCESSRAMCVQDPFVLDHNLTRGIVTSKACDLFNLIIVSDEAIASKSDSLLLALLLSTQNAKVAEAMTSCLCRVQIARPNRDEGEWIPRLWRHLAKVLTSVLKLRVTTVVCSKRPKAVELNCYGFHDTITGRASVENELLEEDRDKFDKLSPIARQIAISDRLLGVSVLSMVKKKTDLTAQSSYYQGDPMEEGEEPPTGEQVAGEAREEPPAEEEAALEEPLGDEAPEKPPAEEEAAPEEPLGDEAPEEPLGDEAPEEPPAEEEAAPEEPLGEEAPEKPPAEEEAAPKDPLGEDSVMLPVSVPGKRVDTDDELFAFMKDVEFPWDSELVDPVNSKPITQFMVRGSIRKRHILIHFQNNGPYDKYVREMTTCLRHKLPDWITAELKQGC